MISDSDTHSADDSREVADSPGTLLRAAREAAGISIDEVAQELHLSRQVVLSLEEDDHAALGAPVFVRGHLRNYARLLDIPVESVVEKVRSFEPEPEEFRTLSAATVVKPAASFSNFVLLILLGIIVLVAAGYLFLGDNESDPANSRSRDFESTLERAVDLELPAAVTDADAGMSAELVDEVPASSSADLIDEGAAASAAVLSPAVNAPAAVQPVAATTEVLTTPQLQAVELLLRFSDECWVEVADAQQRLLYGLEKPGADVRLMGVPPIRIFFGNGTVVELSVAGELYTVPPTAWRGKTARFTIAASAEN